MKVFRVVEFPIVCLREVDVDIEATSIPIRDGVDEFRVSFTLRFCRWVDEGLPVCCFLTVGRVNLSPVLNM
jgi:hypothetical protein